LLDKYPPQTAVKTSEGKSQWLQSFKLEEHIDARLAEQAYRRWQGVISALQGQYFTATTQWRMVVGLGGETVLETDLTLHHLYGLPFIPGSALKGLTRVYVTGEIDEHKSGHRDTDDATVQRIFGTQKTAGSVLFFDAIPVHGKFACDLDIMNAHYPRYYGENQLPTNTQDPNPVTFLTVAKTTFAFAAAPRRAQDTGDAELALQWLQKALQQYGVGGKTNAGYGYFNIDTARQTLSEKVEAVQSQRPVEHIRPAIPVLRESQEIKGAVIAPTDDHRRLAPADTQAFLRYLSFETREVLITVSAGEAQNWKPGETRICVLLRKEEHDGCTLLICQPRAKKEKKK
jgi:CRISPR-associated protein Cmr6